MLQCNDKYVGDKLFAYELGLLSSEEDELVELHLLRCEYCLARAKRFTVPVDMLRHDPESRQTVERLESEDLSDKAAAPVKNRWTTSWRPLVLVAAVVIILLLRPWQLEIHPSMEAVAHENRIAIMYFDNLVDPTDSLHLGEITANLLITGLSQSQSVQVVSSQRLYDILKLLGHEGKKRIDRAVATEIAQKSNAKWMVLGSILEVSPRIVATTQLVDVHSGQVMASQRISGADDKDIFSLADSLTAGIRSELSLPVTKGEEAPRPLANVTTSSPEAYRLYLEGVDLGYKYDFLAAAKCLRKAYEIDSTFAMTYYWIAVYNWLWYSKADTASIGCAVKYSSKVTHREGLYIRCMEALVATDYARGMSMLEDLTEQYPDETEAYRLLGICHSRLLQKAEAVQCYLKALELDSLYKDAYNRLAYEYNGMGDIEKSMWAIDKYISLAPNEPVGYDSRGDLYALNGKLDQAIESYKKSYDLGSVAYLEKLGEAYLFRKDYARADSCFQIMAASNTSKGMRSGGKLLLALIPLYQGKFWQARELLDDGLTADKMEHFAGRPNAGKHFWKAQIYEQWEYPDSALCEVEQVKIAYPKFYHPTNKDYGPTNYARTLALNGRFEEAEKVAEDLKRTLGGNEPIITDYWWTVGNIELAKGNWETAIVDLENAIRYSDPEFNCRVLLATAYMQAGRTDQAIPELEKALSNYMWSRIDFPIQAVKAHYYLGLAYEKSGRRDKAIEQYREFLDIWKDADPGIKEIDDARARLTRLTARS
jgi:tetratricopeptide (TPR) repeat protein